MRKPLLAATIALATITLGMTAVHHRRCGNDTGAPVPHSHHLQGRRDASPASPPGRRGQDGVHLVEGDVPVKGCASNEYYVSTRATTTRRTTARSPRQGYGMNIVPLMAAMTPTRRPSSTACGNWSRITKTARA